jgi:hypothetical protein
MYREYSVFEAMILEDEALEREKRETEPLKKAYLRAVAQVFRFIPMSSQLPKGSIYKEFVKALSGMEYEEYEKLADRRFMRMMEKWKKGEIALKEGDVLRIGDEILETARYLVDVGVFSKYLQILELRRELDKVVCCKISKKPLSVEERFDLAVELMAENGLEEEAGMLWTKYGVFLGVANWFEVLMDVWRMQKDAEEPLLVSAFYIYLIPIVEKAKFVKEYLEKFYRRQLKRYGETPFLNACGVALMKLGCRVKVEEPKSRSAEIIWYW